MQRASLTLDWILDWGRETAVKTRQGQLKKQVGSMIGCINKSHNSMTFAEIGNCTVFM